MKKYTLILLAAGSLTFYACSNSENKSDSVDSTKEVNKETGVADGKTAEFIAKAASGGMMEVEMGRLAQQNGEDERVKSLGALMVEDHSKVNEELKSIAAAKNIVLPATIDEMHQKHIDDLGKKKGKDFDKAYIDMMLDDHKEDIDLFEKQASDGTDAAIKGFAANTLPALKKHLETVKAISGKD